MEQKYHEELENEIMKNTELTRQADMINQMYQESFASLEQQSQKIAHFEEEHCELINKTSQLEGERDHLAGIVKDKNVDLWEGKVEQAKIIIEKLVKECS